MESVGFRSGSKIEIFDFAGHTIIADFSPAVRALLPRALMGASFSGGVAPFLAVVCGLFIGG